MGVMGTRRLVLVVFVSVCAVVGSVLVVGPAAAATQFGSQGSGAGQLRVPTGVAVDATGDVYVGDRANNRIDKFDGSGSFLSAWGLGVAGGEGFQTCTTECRAGATERNMGGFEGPSGVAVDDDPLSSSYGDVYVVDQEHERVEKFDSTGKFLLMFGGHVNVVTGGDVCVAGEECAVGVQGTADGEFSFWPSFGNFIAVGPGGMVYVGDRARVEVFEPSGAWKEDISLASLSATGRPTALAVDSAGDVIVKDEEVSGVRELEPGGAERAFQFDAGSTSVTALALDPSGDLYVGDSSGGFHVLKYDSTGKELDSFGSNTVVGENKGLAFSAVTKELYASEFHCAQSSCNEASTSSVWVLSPPPSGPLVESESAIPGLRGTATLEAVVNPEGNETTYYFEYIDEAHYQSTGFAGASRTSNASIGSGCPGAGTGCFEGSALTAALTGLVPGGAYHYRIVATDAQNDTTDGADQALETVPPSLVEGPWASNVTGTSATLAAHIDPLGASTAYRLEYGTSPSYGHVLSGNVGDGMGYVLISYHEQELQPGVTYHYRLVTTSEVGTVESGDRTFATQGVGSELMLPDGRAWELVSPANKEGSRIAFTGATHAASDGDGITYRSEGVPLGEGVAGNADIDNEQVLSLHGPNGWISQDIQPSQNLPALGEPAEDLLHIQAEYGAFSSDLSEALGNPSVATPLSPEAVEGTGYLRNNITGSWTPLFTDANVPSGINPSLSRDQIETYAVTPDLKHFAMRSALALTPESENKYNEQTKNAVGANLYEWDAGHLHLVSILPDTPSHPHGEAAPGTVYVAGTGVGNADAVPRSISTDGRRIAWTVGVPAGYESGSATGFGGLYVRDMVKEETVHVGGLAAYYQTMSSDGSLIFFSEDGDLFVYNMNTGVPTDLTKDHGAGEVNGGVRDAVTDVSEDGSFVYFVATGVLAKGAIRGADNLYLSHQDGSGWVTSYVATLSGEDEPDWYASSVDSPGAQSIAYLEKITSRVSQNGRFLTFMSEKSLTGYDNIDANSGQPDEEVYLYDASTGRLVCTSCNPTGARPVGVFDGGSGELLFVDNVGSWRGVAQGARNHWLAGSIPSWSPGYPSQPRYLSDSGRMFFTSPDALVPQDTNGLEDVYEYEPAGVGSCGSGNVTFSERSGGCVSLISSGQSASESAFMDASESGDDVFFLTSAHLSPADYDTVYDIYDAHVCSDSLPCTNAPVSSPPCTSGDSCKAAPSPQPTIFGPAPSATFSGAGNVSASPPKSRVAGKSLTRAQKLGRALRACGKRRIKRKRVLCERQARKQYAAKQSRKAIRKGAR
jgi:Tol biopolymer transport system component